MTETTLSYGNCSRCGRELTGSCLSTANQPELKYCSADCLSAANGWVPLEDARLTTCSFRFGDAQTQALQSIAESLSGIRQALWKIAEGMDARSKE